MKCAIALVLALIGLAASNPVPSLGLGLASPVILPSVSVASSFVNHGITIPRVVVPAPIITKVVTAPIINTPIISAPVLGWGSGWGSGLGAWGHGAWGKGWH